MGDIFVEGGDYGTVVVTAWVERGRVTLSIYELVDDRAESCAYSAPVLAYSGVTVMRGEEVTERQ